MQNDRLHNYIDQLIPNRTKDFQELEQYALEHKVPIMEPAGMEFLLQLLRMSQPKRILEVGTAIGYSALRMARALPDVTVVTMERDEERWTEAERNFNHFGLQHQIQLIKGDALDLYEQAANFGPYDVIFIDAAKGQYMRFFQLYEQLLSQNGIIVTDNVLFKGLVAETDIENKRVRKLVEKIHSFNQWLMNHQHYDSVIVPVGDGVAISKKR